MTATSTTAFLNRFELLLASCMSCQPISSLPQGMEALRACFTSILMALKIVTKKIDDLPDIIVDASVTFTVALRLCVTEHRHLSQFEVQNNQIKRSEALFVSNIVFSAFTVMIKKLSTRSFSFHKTIPAQRTHSKQYVFFMNFHLISPLCHASLPETLIFCKTTFAVPNCLCIFAKVSNSGQKKISIQDANS